MDIDSLLQPISADSPGGDDLSFSAEFDAIEELRREDDPTLSQGDWVRPLKSADWAGVVSQCGALLRNRTKDLRLAGWLGDAMGRTRGFAGIADALSLYAGLCERFWDHLHPLPEDGDHEQRIGTLTFMLRQIPTLCALAPMIHSGGRGYGARDIEAARALHQSIARGTADAGAAATQGLLTLDEVTRLQASTSKAFFIANQNDTRRALATLDALRSAVDARLGIAGPSFVAAREALHDAAAHAERLSLEAGATPGAAGESRVDDPVWAKPNDINEGSRASPASGPLQTRAEALRQLRVVAEFFRRTEPHSPVAYLADKAASWGEMPLHDWLRVVLRDSGALAHVEELLGVDPPRPS